MRDAVGLKKLEPFGVTDIAFKWNSGANRPEDVDDAIASRCIARLEYAVPSPDRQAKIWEVLSESAGIKISKKEIAEIVKRNPKLTGRDVKNLLKLGALFAASDGGKVNADRIDFVKSFKPTNEGPV
jgi:AAA+ superfamily predicted ATPase